MVSIQHSSPLTSTTSAPSYLASFNSNTNINNLNSSNTNATNNVGYKLKTNEFNNNSGAFFPAKPPLGHILSQPSDMGLSSDVLYSNSSGSINNFLNNTATNSFYNQGLHQPNGLSSSSSGNKNLIMYGNDIFSKYYNPSATSSVSQLSDSTLSSSSSSSSMLYGQHAYPQQQQQQQQQQSSSIMNAFYGHHSGYFKPSSDYQTYFSSPATNPAASSPLVTSSNQYGSYMNGFGTSVSGSQFQSQLSDSVGDMGFSSLVSQHSLKLEADKSQMTGLDLGGGFNSIDVKSSSTAAAVVQTEPSGQFYVQSGGHIEPVKPVATKRSQGGSKSSNSSNQKKTRTKDKYRVVYNEIQRYELENEYKFSKYITSKRKSDMAVELKLSQRQIKIWFQNRRAKDRKLGKRKRSDHKTAAQQQHQHHHHHQQPVVSFPTDDVKSTSVSVVKQPLVTTSSNSAVNGSGFANVEYLSWSDSNNNNNNNNNSGHNGNNSSQVLGHFNTTVTHHDGYLF